MLDFQLWQGHLRTTLIMMVKRRNQIPLHQEIIVQQRKGAGKNTYERKDKLHHYTMIWIKNAFLPGHFYWSLISDLIR